MPNRPARGKPDIDQSDDDDDDVVVGDVDDYDADVDDVDGPNLQFRAQTKLTLFTFLLKTFVLDVVRYLPNAATNTFVVNHS